MEKRIVYWGIGRICESCLAQHLDIVPDFFIDSYSDRKLFCEKEVKRPDEVKDWSAYYIIITVKDSIAIESHLESRGLQRGKDYLGYREFFSYTDSTITGSLKQIAHYKEKQRKETNPIMLLVPINHVRNTKSHFLFFKEYVKKRKPYEVLMFTYLSVISREEFSEKFGCTVFDIPRILEKEELEKNGYGPQFKVTEHLSGEEINWLQELEDRKISSDKEESLRYSQELYCYYKTVVEIIRPSKIIIWGNWNRESYIVGHIAEEQGIIHGYMEHGWLPGTNQFDPCGIAGQGEYAVNPSILDKIEVNKEDILAVQKVKSYIREKQLDSGVFCETESDHMELKKMDPHRKTIFLIGMGEASMEMNPYNDYWRQYVSDIYLSMKEVLEDLIQVCNDNDLNLVFKPHPREQPLDIDKSDYSGIIYIRDMSVDQLIQMSDVVVSMASAVDYKVLIYGKPLVQVGITGLKGKKCSYKVTKREYLEKEINKALKYGMTQEQKNNYDVFLARLLKKYLWDDMSEKEISYGLTLDTDFGEEGEGHESSIIYSD